MDTLLISALSAVDVRDLSYAEWMNVGMALKHEGYACSVWDEWSRNDQRYHPGECARKWNTFHGSGTPVTGATIVQMAKQRGWKEKSTEKVDGAVALVMALDRAMKNLNGGDSIYNHRGLIIL